MWNDIVYTNAQARNKFQQIEADPENCIPSKLKEPFKQIRRIILEEKKLLLGDLNKINSYAFDLQIGIRLYCLLNNDYKFNERLAAQNEVWRYLSLEVFPDLVYERVGAKEQRFYKESRRIWLRTIWWYIHLSWQGTEEKTLEVIEQHSSDEIMQLVDRSGRGGYRVELAREIMAQFKIHANSKIPNLFRRVLMLNVAHLKMIEPKLVEGGTQKYVENLFLYFLNPSIQNKEMSP
jgi:hypothetical protein